MALNESDGQEPELASGQLANFVNRLKRNQRVFWWFAVLLVILLRMYLVSHDAIMATRTDSLNYARQANHYLAGNPFAKFPKQSPGLSIVAKSMRQLGIPYKLGLDLLLYGAALSAGYLVSRLLDSRGLGFLVFALITLNPWFYSSATLLMSEPLVAIILLSLFVTSCQFIVLPCHRWSILLTLFAGLVSSIYMLTRSELPLLVVYWSLVGFASWLCQRKSLQEIPGRKKWFRLATIAVPLIMAIASTKYVEHLHKEQLGVRAIAMTEASGFKSLINALYSIPPEKEIRFAPVTLQSMNLACDVSPTLAKRRSRLVDKKAPAFGSAKRALELDDEFGTWLNWHLVRAFQGVNARSNIEMQQAANEIRAAQDDGRIGRRFGKYPIDPMWRRWLPEIPKATVDRIASSIHPLVIERSDNQHFMQRRVFNHVSNGFFDDGLLRRNGIGRDLMLRVYGLSNDSRFRRARLLSSEGEIVDETQVIQLPNGQFEFGFLNSDPRSAADLKPKSIELFDHEDQNVEPCRIDIKNNIEQKPVFVKPTNSERERWVISMSNRKNRSATRLFWKRNIRNRFSLGIWIVAVISFLIGLLRGIGPNQLRPIFCFALVGVGFLIARSMFYALVEVWLNWGEFRYVEPNHLFTMVALVCFCFSIGAWANRKFGWFTKTRVTDDSNLESVV